MKRNVEIFFITFFIIMSVFGFGFGILTVWENLAVSNRPSAEEILYNTSQKITNSSEELFETVSPKTKEVLLKASEAVFSLRPLYSDLFIGLAIIKP
mgnify:CR=1 FL=1